MASIESYGILLKAVNNEIQSTRQRPADIREEHDRSPVQDGKCTKSRSDIHGSTEVFMYTTGKETGNLAVSPEQPNMSAERGDASSRTCLS